MRPEFAASSPARPMFGSAVANRSPAPVNHQPRACRQNSRSLPARSWTIENLRTTFGIHNRVQARERCAVQPMNRNHVSVLLFLFLASALLEAHAQVDGKSLAEKLGFGRDAKLLIVHADDVGVTHSVNAATIKALESGGVNSASIMVPCPWFPEIADYAKTHADADFGLHLTLTAERVYYRWGPVAPREKVPTLADEDGYFRHDWTAATHIEPKEAEQEIRAQIERAYAMGIRPTHLDSHQYRLYQNGKDLFDVLVRVAHEKKLPFFVVREWFAQHPYLEAGLGPADIVID